MLRKQWDLLLVAAALAFTSAITISFNSAQHTQDQVIGSSCKRENVLRRTLNHNGVQTYLLLLHDGFDRRAARLTWTPLVECAEAARNPTGYPIRTPVPYQSRFPPANAQ